MHVRIHPRPVGDARMVPLPSEMPSAWGQLFPYVFWLVWGLWLAVSDLSNDEVQAAVIQLVVGGAVLGYVRPKRWFLWALALAAWVPMEPLVARVLHMANTIQGPYVALLLLPAIPALIGGLLGHAVKRSL